MIAAIDKVRLAEQLLKERDGGAHAFNDELIERAPQTHQCFAAALSMDDELADEAVIMDGDFISGIDARIESHAQPSGRMEAADRAGRGREVFGIFSIDATFNRMAVEFDIFLLELKGGARSDAHLLAHEVDAGDHFRDRMFHLQAGVHFDEIESALGVEEFKSADARIAELARRARCEAADFVAVAGVERGRGGFLEDFLMAPLQRAVALSEVDRMTLIIRQGLDFNMARLIEIFFEVDGVIAEGGFGLGFGRRDGAREFIGTADDFHAASAATGRRLDEDRVAQLFGDRFGLRDARDGLRRAGHDREVELLGRLARGDFVAHHRDMFAARADESDVVCRENVGEALIFRKEAVARMDGVRAGDLARGDDRGNIEVAVAGTGSSDAHAFVGESDMHGVFVGGGMDGDGGDAHFFTGAMDAQSDFAAIGDQDFIKHDDVIFWLMRSR